MKTTLFFNRFCPLEKENALKWLLSMAELQFYNKTCSRLFYIFMDTFHLSPFAAQTVSECSSLRESNASWLKYNKATARSIILWCQKMWAPHSMWTTNNHGRMSLYIILKSENKGSIELYVTRYQCPLNCWMFLFWS